MNIYDISGSPIIADVFFPLGFLRSKQEVETILSFVY